MSTTARDEASRTGLYVLCAAVTMSFAAITSAMVVRRSLGNDWSGVPLPALAWINTALLVASSLALEARRRGIAFALGIAFLAGQVAVWRTIAIAASPGDSFFMVFTVAHAAHIAGGLGALVWARPELSRVFWHFLTGLWLYLVVLFTLWGNR